MYTSIYIRTHKVSIPFLLLHTIFGTYNCEDYNYLLKYIKKKCLKKNLYQFHLVAGCGWIFGVSAKKVPS